MFVVTTVAEMSWSCSVDLLPLALLLLLSQLFGLLIGCETAFLFDLLLLLRGLALFNCFLLDQDRTLFSILLLLIETTQTFIIRNWLQMLHFFFHHKDPWIIAAE